MKKEESTRSENNPLSPTDKAISRLLQEDGRRSFADIAAELGLAPSTIQQRANRLFKRGILRIIAAADPVALGVPVMASIAIKADGVRLREVSEEIAQFEEVSYLAICTGRNDILIEIACHDNEHLISFVAEKLAKVKGVRNTETSLYLKIVKNSIQWGVP